MSGGGKVNHRANAMDKIDLSLQEPDMFIIGRYAHPRATFIILPLRQSWVRGDKIWFHLKGKKEKK